MNTRETPKPIAGSDVLSPDRRLMSRMLAIGWQHRRAGLTVAGLNTFLVVLQVFCLNLTGLGVDVVRQALDSGNRPLPTLPGLPWPDGWQAQAIVVAVAAAIAVVSLLNLALKYLTALASAALSQRVVIQLRTAVYDKLQRLSFSFYDDAESGSLINRAAGDVQAVRTFVDGVVFKVLSVLLSLIIYLGYMLHTHVPLTLACLATTPLLAVGSVWFSRTVQPLYRRSSELNDRLVSVITENFQGIHVVKGFAREADQVATFSAAAGRLHDQKTRIFWVVSTFQPLMGLLTQVNQGVLLAFGGYLVIRGELPLGKGLFVFANLLHEFANQVGQLTNIANTIQTSIAGAERVFEILDAPGELVGNATARSLPRLRGEIEFQNVSFGYYDHAPVLQNLSFTIRAGESVGIAGLTGAGKTTLLSLIPRFYDVQQGRILVDGVDVRDCNLQDLRRNIGTMFQSTFLFSNTVAANIAFGLPAVTRRDIDVAARHASADGFIRALPQGYDTLIGEQGANLSGGQRQRLALARTLLLDPPLILLDDATAAVDAETEHDIQSSLLDVLPGRTSLIVSNRLSMLYHTDRVLVIQAGMLVASGPPEELLCRPGPFQDLVASQLMDHDTHADSEIPVRSAGLRPNAKAA